MYITNIFKKIYLNIFPTYSKELKKLMSGCNSLLDVGCGSNSPIKYIKNKPYSVGVDGFGPSLQKSKEQKIHDKYIKININKLDEKIKQKSYDCVLASDVIEHFEKKQANELLKKMEKIAKKKVIIFTPNGFIPQGRFERNPWQIHKSGWNQKEMIEKGYSVIGFSGLKKLRGNFSGIKYRPKLMWRIISDITQLYTRKHPKLAFSLLCNKNIIQ